MKTPHPKERLYILGERGKGGKRGFDLGWAGRWCCYIGTRERQKKTKVGLMVKSLFWECYVTDTSRTPQSRLENVVSGVISWQRIIVTLWKQNRGLWYNGEVWVEVGQCECEARWIGKAVCFPPCLQCREGTDKPDTVSDRGKGTGAALWHGRRVKDWFGRTMERIDHRVQEEFMARVAMKKLMIWVIGE